ncbi:MAG TPA: phospholipase D-like domain-containing protein [bacterium]|nr:phospholipase D-like domain-containing protein [bacterium]
MSTRPAAGRWLLLFLLVTAGLSGCGRPPVRHYLSPELEAGLTRYSDLPARLVELVDSAREEVLVATYEAQLPSVLTALDQARRRGVSVRMLQDDATLGDTGFFGPVTTDRNRYLMHAKFMVVDRRTVWIGSANLTFSSVYRNDNDYLIIRSSGLADYLAGAFQLMLDGRVPGRPFQDAAGLRPDCRVYLNPWCRAALLEELTAARRHIFFSLYALTDPEVIRLLGARSAAGVRVEGILERDWPMNRAAYEKLRRSGVDVRWDGNPNLNHYKLFVIDRARVVTGSYNPTRTAPKNQEVMAVFPDSGLAGFYLRNLAFGWGEPRP